MMTTEKAKKVLNKFIFAGLMDLKLDDERLQDEWVGYVSDVKNLVEDYDSYIESGDYEFINNGVRNIQNSMEHRIKDNLGGAEQNKKDFIGDFAEALGILIVKDTSHESIFNDILDGDR